jgi:hypothetical protein
VATQQQMIEQCPQLSGQLNLVILTANAQISAIREQINTKESFQMGTLQRLIQDVDSATSAAHRENSVPDSEERKEE